MKKIVSLINIFIAALLLHSCSSEQAIDPVIGAGGTKGLMEIKILTDGALKDDHVHTARFITFDNASVFPTVDINERKEFDEEERDAKVFSAMLKVSCNADKLLVVILNEPDAVSGVLNTLFLPSDLEEITYQMADIFNSNHTATVTQGIPMTGMVSSVSVTEENNSESTAEPVELSVKRAIARVELWLRTESEITSEINILTTVTLSRSHSTGYLMDPDVASDFGHLPTVDDPSKEVTWQYASADPLELTDTPELICAFYTPERTCSVADDADKLVLDIKKIKTSGGDRHATITLSDFSNESGSVQNITEIRRNNVYKVAGYVKSNLVEFGQKVTPWTEVGQSIIIDPQYFLTVDRDDLYLPADGDETSIIAETNYDRIDDDRGFPKGICLGTTRYYDSTGQLLDDGSNLSGWLVTLLNKPEGELVQEILFHISGVEHVDYNGCYATVEVKAGNLIKLIKVRR